MCANACSVRPCNTVKGLDIIPRFIGGVEDDNDNVTLAPPPLLATEDDDGGGDDDAVDETVRRESDMLHPLPQQ